VLGVPVESKALKGLDSLLSDRADAGRIPVGTLAIGKAGAINAALLASAILGAKHGRFVNRCVRFESRRRRRFSRNLIPPGGAEGAERRAHATVRKKKK